MARLTIRRRNEDTQLVLEIVDDASAAKMLAVISSSFEDRGGLWVGGSVEPEGGDRQAQLWWLPRADAQIEAYFDADVLPAAAQDLAFGGVGSKNEADDIEPPQA
jgi:hypothetical protein